MITQNLNIDSSEYSVGVVLVNYNTSIDTIKCVNSIVNQTSGVTDYKIIVVDNASEYDDYRRLGEIESLEKVQVVRSKINLGFAAGNMYGVQFVRAKYLFFLNNDCELLNDCVSILYEFCEKNSDVGICSPQMYSENDKRIGSFDYFPHILTRLFGLGVLRLTRGKSYKRRKAVYSDPIKVDVLSGSQLFTRSEFFYKSGGFDINLFLYCEEEDIAFKANRLGYLAYLVPEAKNRHYCGKSTRRNYYIRREFYISYLYVYRKHYNYISTQILKLLLFLRLIKKSVSDLENMRLAFFVLSGAHMKYSLRHKQVIYDK